jgi:hypothetical protein
VTGRINEHRARPVHEVSPRDDLTPALQDVLELPRARLRAAAENRKNGPYRDVEIDIGRSIERIEDQHVSLFGYARGCDEILDLPRAMQHKRPRR